MEKQQKATVGLQPTEPNTLYQKPTNHARRMPMEQNKREQFIIRRIGGTTYKVRVVFRPWRIKFCGLYAMIWLQTTEPMV